MLHVGQWQLALVCNGNNAVHVKIENEWTNKNYVHFFKFENKSHSNIKIIPLWFSRCYWSGWFWRPLLYCLFFLLPFFLRSFVAAVFLPFRLVHISIPFVLFCVLCVAYGQAMRYVWTQGKRQSQRNAKQTSKNYEPTRRNKHKKASTLFGFTISRFIFIYKKIII